jgi:Fe-S oxidoreductase
MSHLEVLDFIILILEGLLGIVTICESGYKMYKEYKSYMEDRKKRMKVSSKLLPICDTD